MAIQMAHNPQTSLTKEQKHAVGLLSIGTFLEYFDLMLYVHMAVLLNELFFPKVDPFTTSLISAFAFSATFVFRPFGALIFGYIGDNYGRKSTVIITTAMMSMSCLVMAYLPTYKDIGITAAILVTICRIVQGISSMGEMIGAEIYITEITKPPIQYPAVTYIMTFGSFGAAAALGVATLVTSFGFSWRIAFGIGSVIAVVGMVARTTLRETPEFADAKRQLKKIFKDIGEKTSLNIDEKTLDSNIVANQKVSFKTTLSYFFIQSIAPVTFCFTYLHCSTILKDNFFYNSTQIIHHNFIISMIALLESAVQNYLCFKIYPLTIIKFRLFICIFFLPVLPYLLSNASSPFELMLIQTFFIFFKPCLFPATPIFIKHFPVFKRFTYVSWLYALARALMYVVTSFGLVYLVKHFNQYGILFVIIPTTIGFTWGIFHFSKLEKEAGNYL
jgi:MFS family permease